MKIIFLDIDGVLITNFNHDKIDQEWNRSCINNLMYIINKTGAEIIISSSWRHNIKNLKQAWIENGLDWSLIKGVTPSRTGGGRDEEIRQRLEWKTRGVINMKDRRITIDDEHYSLKECDKMGVLVRTELKYGITREKAKEAIELLNN